MHHCMAGLRGTVNYCTGACEMRKVHLWLSVWAVWAVQGQHQAAIQHLKRVLEISQEMGDYVGDADAFGTIAGAAYFCQGLL